MGLWDTLRKAGQTSQYTGKTYKKKKKDKPKKDTKPKDTKPKNKPKTSVPSPSAPSARRSGSGTYSRGANKQQNRKTWGQTHAPQKTSTSVHSTANTYYNQSLKNAQRIREEQRKQRLEKSKQDQKAWNAKVKEARSGIDKKDQKYKDIKNAIKTSNQLNAKGGYKEKHKAGGEITVKNSTAMNEKRKLVAELNKYRGNQEKTNEILRKMNDLAPAKTKVNLEEKRKKDEKLMKEFAKVGDKKERKEIAKELNKTFEDPDKYRDATKNKKGKHTVTKQDAERISRWWKGLSQDQRDKIIKDLTPEKELKEKFNKANKIAEGLAKASYDEKNNTVKWEDLNPEEYQQLQNAERIGGGNSKTMEKVVGKKQMKKVASITASDFAKGGISTGTAGFLSGISLVDPYATFNDYYSQTQKNAITDAKESGAYLAGYGLGVGGQFMLGGVPQMGSSLARNGLKLAPQGISRTALQGGLKNIASVDARALAKQAGREILADDIVSAPLDVLDAYKTALDTDGKFDPATFAKTYGLNVAMNTGIGGAMSGGGALYKGAKIKNAISLKNKLETGNPNLTPAERKLMNEINARQGKMDDTGFDQYDTVMGGADDLNVARDRYDAKSTGGVGKALQSESAWAGERPEPPKPKDWGYHAGDLGKAEHLGNQSGNRGTGHYGTGTYFFGDEGQAAKYGVRDGKARPQNKIDFSEYNLYRPKSEEEGLKLHSALAKVNNSFSSATENLPRAKKISDLIKRYEDGDENALIELRNALPEEDISYYRVDAEKIPNSIKYQLSEEGMQEGYRRLARELKSFGMDVPTFDEYRAMELELHGNDLDDFDIEKAILGRIEDDLDEIKDTYDGSLNWVATNTERLKEFFPDKTEKQIADALEKAQKELGEHIGKPSAYEKDSATTILMKELGYEGVDVRGMKRLDNEQYGSVIYDIKPPKNAETAEAKGSVGGAKREKTEAEKKADKAEKAWKEAKKKRTEAKKELSGAKRHAQNSKNAHGEVNPETQKQLADAMEKYRKAENAVERAEKKYKKAKQAIMEERKIAKRSKINSVEDFAQSDAIPKIVHPKEAGNEAEVVKGVHREWISKADSVIGRFWQAVGDELSPFERLANIVDPDTAKLIRATLNRMRTVRSIHAVNVTGKASKRGSGQVSFDGKRVGDSLDEIFKKAELKTNGKTTKSKIEGNVSKEEDFDYYCRLKSNLDLLKAGDEDHPPFLDGMTIEGTENTLKGYEKAYGEEIINFQKAITKYADNDMQYAVDGGLMQASTAKKLRDINPNYVPAYRSEDVRNYKRFEQYDDISAQGAFRKRKGSDENLAPLYSSLVARNAMILKKTEMNGLMNIVCSATTMKNADISVVRKTLSDEEILNSIDKVAYINKDSKGNNIASFFDANGNLVEMKIPDDAVKGLRSWSGEEQLEFLKWRLVGNVEFGDVLRGVAKGNRLFKDLITGWNPIFGAKNVIRDTQTAFVNTQYGVGAYVRNYGRAVSEMRRNGDLYKMYKQNGGQFSTMVKEGSESFQHLSKLSKLNPLKALEEFNNALETMPRFAEFCASAEANYIKKGGKDLTGVGNSAEKARLIASKMDREATIIAVSDAKEVTVNFARSGQIGRLLNSSLVPYFNPALQGLYKMGKRGQEAFQGHAVTGAEIKKGKLGYTTKVNKNGQLVYRNMSDGLKYVGKLMAIGTGASLAFELYHDLMKDNEEYKQLSSYTKNTYFCVPIGDGHFLKIPKARDLSAISTIPNHLFRSVVQTPDGTVYDAFKTSWEQIGAVNPFTDNIFSPLWRLHTGKNWYGEPLESEEDKVLIQNGKYDNVWDENTSSISIGIAHSPVIEAYNKAVMKGYENGVYDEKKMMGKILTPKRIESVLDGYTGMVYDLGITQFSMSAKEYGLLTPVVNNFVVDSVVKNQNSQNFYLKSDKYYKTMAYIEDNDGDVSSKEYKEAQAWVRKYGQESSTISRAINEIQMSEDFKPKEKYEMIRKLKKAQTEIQRAGLNNEDVKVDALGMVADCIGVDRTFSSESLTHRTKGKDGEYKENTWYDSYSALKKSDVYKKANETGKKKLQQDYLAIYNATSKCETEAGGSTLYPDYITVAMAYKTTEKNKNGQKINKGVTKIFKDTAYESTQKRVDKYVDEYDGTMKSYTKTYKTLQEGKEKLGAEYLNDIQKGESAMILAESGKKFSDREYYIAGCDSKVNSARWADKDGITSDKLHKFIKKHKINRYTDKDELEKFIKNEKWINTDRKRSEVYALCYGYFKKNTPFGTLPAFPIDGDMIGSGSGSGGWGGRGRRRGGWGHHGRRGHGGGGGSSKKGTGSYQDWLKAHGYTSGGTSSGDSALTEAFRKRQLKNLQATTRRVKS